MVTIAAEGLSIALGGRDVLDTVSVSLDGGSLIGIVGPNGAGKTTLARALIGLLPARAGRVTIDGEDVAMISPRMLGQRIAYLPQIYALHWPLSVERLIGLGRLPHLGPFSRLSAGDRAAIAAAMRATDTLQLADRTITELSGGEQARVMLARALATGASAIVADEPLASLDPGHQIEIMTLLRDRARAGALIAVVLHDLSMAVRFCDRLLLLDRGRLAAAGAPATVLSDAMLERVYGITAWRGEIDGETMLVPFARSIDAAAPVGLSHRPRQVPPHRG